MKSLLARLSLTLLAFAHPRLVADEAADIAKFGVTVPTTGLVPVVVEGQELSAENRDFSENAAPVEVDLRPRFTISGLRGAGHDLVQFHTSLGAFNAELLADGSDAGAEDLDPHVTVNNFKAYLATDSTPKSAKAATYDGTVFHRSANLGNASTPRKIIQGGGYRLNAKLSALPKKPAIVREFHYANTRGTIAMARTAEANSATSEWFININDNTPVFNAGSPDSTTDDNTYAVFARVIGNGMSVVDRIGNLSTYNLGGAFGLVPVHNVRPGQLLLSNLVAIQSVRVVPLQPADDGKGASALTYSITNDNPSAATATLSPSGRLLVVKGKHGGRALITVRAREAGGASVDSTLTVTHPGPPLVVKQLPAKTSAALGSSFTLAADITAWPLHIRWQRLPAGLADTLANWNDIALDDARFEGAATEYLKVKLTGADPTAVGQALALDGSKFRFRLANTADVDGAPAAGTVYSRPTALKVATSPLAFAKKLPAKTTAALGATITLSTPAKPTYPSPTYQWQRKAPNGDWEDIVDSKSSAPVVASPYTGTKTANLTIRLNGRTPASSSSAIDTLATLALHQSQYRCVITHDLGAGPVSAETNPTTLNITTLPVAIATQPEKLVYGRLAKVADVVNTARISLVAKPAATNTPLSYQWQRYDTASNQWVNLVNHVAPTPADDDTPADPGAPTAYAGVTTSALTIRLPGDKNTSDGFGLSLDGAQFRCVVSNVLKTASSPFGPAAGTAISNTTTLRIIAGALVYVTDHQFSLPGLPGQNEGRAFSATGLPRGISINTGTGLLTGIPTAKPGVYQITVTVTEGGQTTTYTYYIEVEPLTGGTVGAYEALLAKPQGPHFAKLTLTISANGLVTGTLQTELEPKPLALRGAVVREQATGKLTFTAPVEIKRPGKPAGRVYLLNDLAIESSGFLSVKLHSRESADVTPVEIASAAYNPLPPGGSEEEEEDPEAPINNPGRQLGVHSKKAPAPWHNVNSYNLAITAPALLDSASSDVRPFPAGSGYANAPVLADGRLNMKGKLADGTKFTASLRGGTDASFRLFLRPYGSAPGSVLSADLPMTYPSPFYQRHSVFGEAGQDAYWTKPELPKTANYRAGFGPLGLSMRLEPWFPSNFNDFGFHYDSDNKLATDLLLSGAALGASASELPVKLAATFRVPIAPFADLAANNASKFSGTLDTRSGFFKGSFMLIDDGVTRKVPFEGTLLMSEDIDELPITAEGFILVPALEGGASATLSGRIQFKDPTATEEEEEEEEEE